MGKGQYITKVEEGSPASAAGLKEGDKIIEVNCTNIELDHHLQVVKKIGINPNETKLLVADFDTEKFYKDKGIVISSSLPAVVSITCPDTMQATGEIYTITVTITHNILRANMFVIPHCRHRYM
jgi:membrane-associated protease RseP (regulator of RpoE activity)